MTAPIDPTFALKPAPPIVRPAFVPLLALLGACAGFAVAVSAVARDVGQAGWWVAGAITGAALALVLGLRGARRIQAPPVVVTATELLLPAGPRARAHTRVPLTEITSIEERARKKDGKQRVLVIGTRTGFHALPAAAFADPDAPAHVRAAVRAAVAALPGGPALLTAMVAHQARARGTLMRRPVATGAFGALVAFVFAIELASGALRDNVTLLALGANAPALVVDGAWWRLFSAALLHLNGLHIALNVVALLSFGALLEKLIATPRFVVAALAGGFGGNVATLAGSSAFSLGASSLIFGLIGALLVVNVRHRSELPSGFYFGRDRWLRLLVPNVLLSLLPGVSSLAHAGGFATGASCALLFGRGWLDALNAPAPADDAPATPPAAPPDAATPTRTDRGARAWAVAAVAWTIAYAVAIACAAHHAVTTPRAVLVRELMVSALAADLPADAARTNLTRVVDDPASDRALLERARASCARLLPGDELCARLDARLDALHVAP